MRVWIAVLLAWLCFGGSALAEKKLALVIGNDAYQHIDALRKARADAKSYADLLREKGFWVEDRYDLGIVDMQAAVGEFVEKIEPGDTAVFVYSGHGWSDGAHNYLLGVDVPDRAGQDLLKELSLPIRNGATGILDVFDGKRAGLKVAIIDACRDSPFHQPAGGKGYGLARGLRPEGIEGSFVVYSAGEGQSAMDRLSEADTDPNSVFTRAFLPLLRADLPLRDAIKASQAKTHALAAAAYHDQTPAYYDEVLGEACLSAACTTFAVPAPSSSASDDAFSAIIDTQTSPDALAGMIAKLPDGRLKERARKKLAALRESQVAKVPPAPPSPGPTTSDDAFAAIIDAQTSPDVLAGMMAKLPDGRLKERAKKKLAALRKTQVANLSVVPTRTTSPASITSEMLIGKWGLASYRNGPYEARAEIAAREQCGKPYVIGKGPTGGVMMYQPDQSKAQELVVKAGDDKTFIGPADDPAGGQLDRQVVSFDGNVMITQWIDPDVVTRYGTMVFVRCSAK
jgi:hypothetical protein